MRMLAPGSRPLPGSTFDLLELGAVTARGAFGAGSAGGVAIGVSEMRVKAGRAEIFGSELV